MRARALTPAASFLIQEYESKCVEFSKQGHKAPEIMALNPRGQVPTLVDEDGTVVCESLAAVLYLDRAYPAAGTALVPAEPAAAGPVLQRTLEAGVLHAKISDVIYPKMRGTLASEESVAAWNEKVEALKAELGYWEGYAPALGSTAFLCGDAFTAADAAVAPFLLGVRRFGATLAAFPKLAAYADRLAARPSVASTWPPHWKESEGPGWMAGVGL